MDPYLKVMIGDNVPAFHLRTLDGELFDSRSGHNKVRLINFFIIKCPYCKDSLRFLNEHLWENVDNTQFEMISIGREHTLEELIDFNQKKAYRFPMAADPGRQVYDQFAIQKVPRNFIIDRKGTIIHHTRGFNEEEHNKLLTLIKNLCSH
jgi:peroxiredoxin